MRCATLALAQMVAERYAMIPLYDDNPTRRIPWTTWFLVAANIAAFVYELSLPAEELTRVLTTNGFLPSRFFTNPADPAQLLTLVTAQFLHAGWLHLLGNLLYLWIFGNNVEDRFGHWRFALFYVMAGAVAAMAHGATDPASSVPVVGASGAIAGVLGAYALLYPRARVVSLIPIVFFFELAAIPALFVIVFWFALQLAQGLGALGSATAGVAWWAHIAGFLFGIVVTAPVAALDRIRARA